MKKCIERDAALKIVFDACAECMSTCEEFDGIYADCHQCPLEGVKLKLRDLPAADVRPVQHGVWLKIKYRSICRDCSFRGFASWNYCPNCGRQMATEGENG